jgi:hypothetical protein
LFVILNVVKDLLSAVSQEILHYVQDDN